MPRPTRLRGRAAVRRLRNRIDALTRSRAKRQSNGDTLPDDLLTRLINSAGEFDDPLSFGEIEDHILTFIAAGHETTARGLSWLLYLLTHDPRSMAKVYSEVDAVDLDSPPSTWQSKLPFLTACFDEAMRLYPPAPFLTRMARKDDRFGLAFVPAGGYLFLNLYALHRHRLLWEQPDSFKPERFMDRASANIGKYQYLPFGVGHRTCIGGHFAVLEATIILVLTLRRYRFEYAGEKPPWPVMRITLKPDNDMPMRVFHR
jgi:cytochrome P450